MNAYRKLTLSGLKAFARDRMGLFWSLFLPLTFIVLFGSLSGHGGNDSPKFTIGVVMQDSSPAAAWVPGVFSRVPIFIVKQGTLASETSELQAGKRSAIVVFPANFSANMVSGQTSTARILYDPMQQTAQTVTGVISQVIGGISARMSGQSPLLQASPEPTLPHTGLGKKTSPLDFLLPGILAMSIMQLGIFTAIPLITMREKGILKRFRATPLPRTTLVGSQVTMRLIIGLLQTAFLVTLGTALYQFHVACSWLVLLAVVGFGILTFISLGAVLASFAKTQEAGMPMVQLTNMPMIFLSGLFFPADILPHAVQPIANILPATYLADLLRHVMLGTASHHSVLMDVGAMSAWLVVCLLVAARYFRWE